MQFRLGVCGLVVWLVGATASANPPKPTALDKPSFSATPAELLAAAKTAPAGDWKVVILREEDDASFDDRGRVTHRWRRVFLVRSQAGIDDWGTLNHSWRPFYQDKPTVRARVIAPDGTVATLDPKLIHDAPTHSESSAVFSDHRAMQVPLPRLQIGSVVEEEIVTIDRQPILPSDGMRTVGFGERVPTVSTRAVLSAPAARKPRLLTSKLPPAVTQRREVAGGRETWRFEAGLLAAQPEFEGSTPGDLYQRPYAAITIASWPQLAREYRKVVDQRIAEGPFALPAGLPKTATLDTVRAITAWLHREIRYTGIELGEAAIIPWSPAETAKRGFGDCKDKATLLVAMLRQAGIRADLALLLTGPGADVLPALAGMGQFDHAIVRARVGGKDVWIDATEDLLPPGQLPARDQGRQTLIIADDTRSLVLTPAGAPAANLVREVRTFELAELGFVKRVIEVSTEGGVFESAQRAWLRDGRADDVKKNLEGYAGEEYGGTYLRHSSTPPADVSTPLAVTLEVADAKRAYTDRGQIDVYVNATDALAKVPELFTTAPDAAPARRHDFQWFTPHTYEIENRLVLPAGFTMPTPPADRTHALGTARLLERHRVDGTAYVVTFRFESGKPRITPAEVATLRREIAALDARGGTRVVIAHTATALAQQGKLREAFDEVQRLIRLHPKEALHHTQLVDVLVEAGMGQAARRAARKAIELEPKNADAHATLGWVLRRDSLGREYGFDHDRAGAIAAYRKARALDPKHEGAAMDLAMLLEHDARGKRFQAGTDFAAAIEARRAVHALAKTDAAALDLATTLFFARQYAEAEKVLRGMKAANERDDLLIAVLAAQSPAAAIEAAGRMRAGSAKTEALASAASVMMLMRNYDTMRALLAATGVLRAGTADAEIYTKLRAHDPRRDSPRDPRTPLFDMLQVTTDPAYRSRYVWDAQTADELRASPDWSGPELDAMQGFDPAVIQDIMRSAIKVSVDGAGPWRVASEFMGETAVLYVALDGGVAKIVGSPQASMGVGRHVLRLLAKNDEAGARRLLEWLKQDRASPRVFTIFENAVPADREGLQLAAILLAATSVDHATSVPVLARCKAKSPDAREACDQMLAYAYAHADKWNELATHAQAWITRKPQLEWPTEMRFNALLELRKFDEAGKQLDDAKHLDEAFVTNLRAQLAVARGKLDDAVTAYEHGIKRGDRVAMNESAWLRVLLDRDLPGALDTASRAVGTDKPKAKAAHVHTLATVEAELGHLQAAKRDALQAMANGRRVQPADIDLYVLGRIAEQLGLRDDAVGMYRRIKPDKGMVPSVGMLAQRRLKVLGTK